MPDGTARQVMLESPSISGTAAFSETTFVIKTTNQAQGMPGAGNYEYSGTYTLKGGTIYADGHGLGLHRPRWDHTHH